MQAALGLNAAPGGLIGVIGIIGLIGVICLIFCLLCFSTPLHGAPMSAPESNEYSKEFSESSFWDKVRSAARPAGTLVLEKVFALYFAFMDSDTPVWAKTVILSALGYFILPLDAIPDLIPIAGYTDDLGALAVAIGTVAAHLKKEHWERARQQCARFFGPDEAQQPKQ